MGTIHNNLGLGEIHQNINIVYADDAERDADTVYSTNPDNLFKEAFISGPQELQLLIDNAPTWITTMSNPTPGIDAVLAVDQILQADDRAITVIDDIFLNIDWFDQAVNAFNEGSFLHGRGSTLAWGRKTGDGAGATTATSQIILDSEDFDGFLVEDGIHLKGLFYNADYSANFTDRSLIDKAYADGLIHGNIYTEDGTIDDEERIFNIINGSELSINNFNLTPTTFTLGSGIGFGESSLTLKAFTGDGAGAQNGVSQIVLSNVAMLITDSINSKGLTYNADYSANFTDRSLIDKAYADAGADTQVIFNDNGVLIGDAFFRRISEGNIALRQLDNTSNALVEFHDSAGTADWFIGLVQNGTTTPDLGLIGTGGSLSLQTFNDDINLTTTTSGDINILAADVVQIGNITVPSQLAILRAGTVPAGAGVPAGSAAINTQGDGSTNADIISDCVADSAFATPKFTLRRAGATANLLVDGDVLGLYEFKGHDGVGYQNAATIRSRVDGAAAAGNMPGRIDFLTTPPGSTTPLERMRIDSDGNVGIGSISPEARLHVQTGDASVSPLGNRQIITEGTGGGGGIAMMGEDTTELSLVFGFPSNNGRGGIFYFPGSGMQFRTNGSNTRMQLDEVGNVGINQGSPTSRLDIDGSLSVGRLASATSVNSNDEVIIGITDTTAARTVTLLTADIVANRLFIIKDESGAAGTNNITVATEAAETIDGNASVDITVNYGVLRLYSDGSNLFSW